MRRLTLLGLTLLILGVWASPCLAQGRISNILNDYDLDDEVGFIYCDPANVGALIGACTTGLAAGDGWIDTRGHSCKTVGIAIDALVVVGGVDITFEVRYQKEDGTFTAPITLMNLINKATAVTDNQSVRIPDEVMQFRVGIVIGTNDDADVVDDDIDIIYNAK